MAVDKFQNRNIVDSIERNARDVDRKLGATERIMAPLAIVRKHDPELTGTAPDSSQCIILWKNDQDSSENRSRVYCRSAGRVAERDRRRSGSTGTEKRHSRYTEIDYLS